MSLPDINHDEYWASYHRAPDPWWSPAIDLIAQRNQLDFPKPKRAKAGRNVVVLAGDWIVKLVPPFWIDMWNRERIALDQVHGRLSVPTPLQRTSGRIDSWGYIVMERIEGMSLGWRAELGTPAQRAELAILQGRLAREISQLQPIDSLRWDWTEVLDEDRFALASNLENLPAHLAATAADYVDQAGDLATGDTFIQGDLSSINFLSADDGTWNLIDWSDASVGPVDHEFISPFMHQFRGDPAGLEAFWSGYGPVTDPEAIRHRIMARSILKYAKLMPGYLSDLPGPVPASWSEAAERFALIPES
ncbi:MAG: phosphotransferase [Acidimicrobiia bacterium]